jgi:hypothetical protein
MLSWIRRKLASLAAASRWSVQVADGVIRTSDGQGTTRELPVAQLKAVVVATGDSGPWGDDFVFLLYDEAGDLAGLFPIEAEGRDAFVEWLGQQPGYSDDELRKASGCTSVARFNVYQRQD